MCFSRIITRKVYTKLIDYIYLPYIILLHKKIFFAIWLSWTGMNYDTESRVQLVLSRDGVSLPKTIYTTYLWQFRAVFNYVKVVLCFLITLMIAFELMVSI